jgi:dodecin
MTDKNMTDSVYKFIEMVGTSKTSWEEAVVNAVETASKSLRDTRVAEIKTLDVKIDGGKVVLFRANVRLSFKYDPNKE